MSHRYLPLVLIASSLGSAALAWRLGAPLDETAPKRILRIAVSRSARWIAAGSANGWIGIIDQQQPDAQQRFRGGEGLLRDLRFTTDEQWVVVANNHEARHAVQSLGSLEPMAAGEDRGEPTKGPAWAAFDHSSNVVEASDGTLVSGNNAGSIDVRNAAGVIVRRYTFR